MSWAQGIQSDGRGHTYLGTDSGLVELTSVPGKHGFTTRTFAQVPGTTGHGAYGMLLDGNTLWYGCGQELCHMSLNGTLVFGKESGLPELTVLAIRKSRSGDLWVRAKDLGVFVMPVGQTKFRRPVAPIPGVALGIPATDADGRIMLPSPAGLLTEEQRDFLYRVGCHSHQGFLFSRPLPLEKFEMFLAERLKTVRSTPERCCESLDASCR